MLAGVDDLNAVSDSVWQGLIVGFKDGVTVLKDDELCVTTGDTVDKD